MSKYFKAGLFFTIAALLVIAYIMKTADRFEGKSYYLLYADMEDASGLIVDSNIRVAGVVVGKLKAITLHNNKARITMQLSKDVKVYEDAVVQKKMESMLGTSVVYLMTGTPGKRELQNKDTVNNVISNTVLDSTMENMGAISQVAYQLAEKLKTILDNPKTDGQIADIIDIAHKTTKDTSDMLRVNMITLQSLLKNMDALARKVNNQSDEELRKISLLIDNSVNLTATLDKMLKTNDADVRDSVIALKKTLAELSEQVAASRTTIQNMNNITTDINEGRGNVGKLLKDEELYDDIKNISNRVSEYMDSTIGLDFVVDFKSEYMFKHKSTKDHFGLTLVPGKKDRYYSFSIINSYRDSRSNTTRQITVTDHNDPSRDLDVTINERKESNKLLLSAQIARIFGPLTIRGGVIESSGGIGVDIAPVSDVYVSGEFFDFGRKENPYIRVSGTIFPLRSVYTGSFYPLRWLYITGGVDDLAWDEGRDYFLGGGLRFTDNDLKGVITVMPSM